MDKFAEVFEILKGFLTDFLEYIKQVYEYIQDLM